MNRDDLILAKVLVEKGWVSETQVQECAKALEQEDKEATVGRKTSRPLGVVLVAKGLITDDQLIRLMEEIRQRAGGKRGSAPPRLRLGQILMEHKAATIEQIEAALEKQAVLRKEGKNLRLGEILVADGVVEARAVVEALKEQDKTMVICTACRTRFNVVGYRPSVRFECRKCGSLLEPATDTITADESTRNVPKAGPVEPPPDVQEASLEKERHLGKYILIRPIVEGKFGQLWRSWHKDQNCYVGLVRLDRDLNPEQCARLLAELQQEARKVGSLVHRILETAEHDGKRFAVVSIL